MGFFTKDIKTLDDLFVHTLRDIYYAEQQIAKNLPDLIEKAIAAALAKGLRTADIKSEGCTLIGTAQMGDAILVNPYSKDEISDAIRKALDMPKKERVERWQKLVETVRRDDVVAWRKGFVAALAGDTAVPAAAPAASVPA